MIRLNIGVKKNLIFKQMFGNHRLFITGLFLAQGAGARAKKKKSRISNLTFIVVSHFSQNLGRSWSNITSVCLRNFHNLTFLSFSSIDRIPLFGLQEPNVSESMYRADFGSERELAMVLKFNQDCCSNKFST